MRRIFAFLVCTLFFAGSSNAELVVSYREPVEPTIGDFFQYEAIGNHFPDGMGKAIDEEKYLRVEDYDRNGMRIEIVDMIEEVDGETVDYIAMLWTWETSFTLYFDDAFGDGDGKEDTVEVSMVMTEEVWQINEGLFNLNGTNIKSSLKQEMTMIMTFNEYEEQTVLIGESIEETEIEHISTSINQPNEIRVGDVWTMSTTEQTTGTYRERTCEENDDNCEWEIEDIDEEETVTTTSEVLAEVSVKTASSGTFEALEIKDIDEGEDSGTYSLEYVSVTGLPIKLLVYLEGEINMDMQLASCHVSALGVCENLSSAEEDADGRLGDLPSLPLFMSLAMIALIASRKRLQ